MNRKFLLLICGLVSALLMGVVPAFAHSFGELPILYSDNTPMYDVGGRLQMDLYNSYEDGTRTLCPWNGYDFGFGTGWNIDAVSIAHNGNPSTPQLWNIIGSEVGDTNQEAIHQENNIFSFTSYGNGGFVHATSSQLASIEGDVDAVEHHSASFSELGNLSWIYFSLKEDHPKEGFYASDVYGYLMNGSTPYPLWHYSYEQIGIKETDNIDALFVGYSEILFSLEGDSNIYLSYLNKSEPIVWAQWNGEEGIDVDALDIEDSQPIPEPASMILLGSLATGLFGVFGIRRKFSRR